jgi:phosphate:Na+ symporter
LAGIGVTALLQSSTAACLLMTSFAARGLVELVPGLAVMLGANIGTTLIVQALSFDVSALAPLLFLAGLLAFNFGGRTITRDLGRVAIGLGLMLLSLHVLIDTLAPAENAPSVQIVLAAITSEPILCVLFAAVFTWAAHSSAAVVLLVMSLAYSHFVSPVAALALVLGANVGSAINPLLEGSRASLASRRLPVGNMFNRLVGVALVLPFLQPIADIFTGLIRIPPAWRPTFTPSSTSSWRRHSSSFLMASQSCWCGYCPNRKSSPIHQCRFTSTRRQSAPRQWRWPALLARRCTWAMWSRPC